MGIGSNRITERTVRQRINYFKKFGGSGHFPKHCKKEGVNQIDGSCDFTLYVNNVICVIKEERDERDLGVFCKTQYELGSY